MHAIRRAERIPELAATPLAKVRLGDGRDVALTPRVAAVVDHPAFQRLRRVRQLGPTHLVYPGATHTRFEHSLGVYGTARAFLLALLHDADFAASVREADILALLAAALLHDVGHYPFAHSLEAVHREGFDTPRHERLAAAIVEGRAPGLPRGRRPIADILRFEWRVSPERVVRLIAGEGIGEAPRIDRILRSVLSGAVDADKMDYVERDSVHLGVPYGRHYDRARLLAALTLTEAGDALAIRASGKISAEFFVFCRHAMFSEVYWHHTVRAASAMVQWALADHVRREQPDPRDLASVLLTHGDDALLSWLHACAPEGSVTDRLLRGLSGDRRRLYKRLVTWSQAYAEEPKRRAWQAVYDADSDAHEAMRQRIARALADLAGHPVHEASVLLDVPPRDKDRVEHIAVRFEGVSGQGEYPLAELSSLVAGVQRDMLRVVKKIRVFVEPSLAAALRGMQRQVEEVCLREVLAP